MKKKTKQPIQQNKETHEQQKQKQKKQNKTKTKTKTKTETETIILKVFAFYTRHEWVVETCEKGSWNLF